MVSGKRRGPVRPKVEKEPSVKTREVRGEATSSENLGAKDVQNGAEQKEVVVEGRDMRKESIHMEGRDMRKESIHMEGRDVQKELIHMMKVAFEGRDARESVELVHGDEEDGES